MLEFLETSLFALIVAYFIVSFIALTAVIWSIIESFKAIREIKEIRKDFDKN